MKLTFQEFCETFTDHLLLRMWHTTGIDIRYAGLVDWILWRTFTISASHPQPLRLYQELRHRYEAGVLPWRVNP